MCETWKSGLWSGWSTFQTLEIMDLCLFWNIKLQEPSWLLAPCKCQWCQYVLPSCCRVPTVFLTELCHQMTSFSGTIPARQCQVRLYTLLQQCGFIIEKCIHKHGLSAIQTWPRKEFHFQSTIFTVFTACHHAYWMMQQSGKHVTDIKFRVNARIQWSRSFSIVLTWRLLFVK